MRKSWFVSMAFLGVAVLATPARADFCIQFSQNLSGSVGFFRFKGGLPKTNGKVVALRGRRGNMDDYGPTYGAATVGDTGSYVVIAAHFVADGEPGEFIVEHLPGPGQTVASSFGVGSPLSGRSTYGESPSWQNETGTIVACP